MTEARPNPQSIDLGPYDAALRLQLEDWRATNKVSRLWERDATLWTGGNEGRWLGWLDVIDRQLAAGATLAALQQDIVEAGFRHAVVLGMGGSSLCPEVLSRTFPTRPGFPELHILDSTVPAQILSLERRLALDETLFIVASKSGSTSEPNAFERYFFARSGQGKRFIAVTDPGSALEELARAQDYRAIFPGEPEIGGRFSALSNFGMVPAAVMGLDPIAFLTRARTMVEACGPGVAPEKNPAVALGIALGVAALEGRDKVTIVTSEAFCSFGAWLEQLIAESTGKHGKGVLPVALETLGAPPVYGDDRIFVHLALSSDPSKLPAGYPSVKIVLDSADDLGQEFFRWELATAVLGAVLELDAFDQPDVEAAKVKTRVLSDRYQETGELPAENGAFPSAEELRALLDQLERGDYFAIQAYVERSPENDAVLQSIRMRVRDTRRVATTLGYGPRFLHSTGQFHKGGPNRGVFLQITADDAQDIEIPGRRYTFGHLKRFQAQGDLEVLRERGRRVLRAHLGRDVTSDLERLAERLS